MGAGVGRNRRAEGATVVGGKTKATISRRELSPTGADNPLVRKDLETRARAALGKNLAWLKENCSASWPKGSCEDTCSLIFSDLRELMRGDYDCRRLHMRHGRFDTVGASGNEPTSRYGNIWEQAHVWIEWDRVIIDPTASQFLPYLQESLLVVTPDMIEHSFYLPSKRRR